MRDSNSILLIEDETLVMETLKGNFLNQGYRVTTARNGEEGIRKFQNHSFDLVITDLKLRGMDGLQVSRKINKINPETPVILVTGHPRLLTPEETSRVGVRDYILKPFTWDQIKQKVAECLESPLERPKDTAPRLSSAGFEIRKKETDQPAPRLEPSPGGRRKDPYHSLSQFLFGQTRTLEMLQRGEPVSELLQNLILVMEGCADEVVASIHLVNDDRTQLEMAAGPSLPGPLSRDIHRLPLQTGDNPWISAVFQNKPVFVEDIRKSSLWEGRSASSKICGFRGSWSFPLRAADQKVAGVLTFYSRDPRSPSTVELKWILSATRLLGILLEHRKLEGALKEQAQGSHTLPLSGEEALVMFNESGAIEACNAQAARLFGYPDTSLIGQNIKKLITGKGPALRVNPFHRKEGEGDAGFDTLKSAAVGLHKDGSRLYLEVSVGEMGVREGRRFVATISDVSRPQFAETVYRETRETLAGLGRPLPEDTRGLKEQLVQSEKWAATGKLAASLAHEFKNPLFGILNVLERASREFELKQGSEDLIALAIQECYRVMELAKKLQDFQRPSSHSAEPVDINSAVRDLVMLARAQLDKRSIELILELDETIPRVVAVEDQIKQVVLNLLNNAVEAVEDGVGKILIRTRALETTVQIIVQDNGRGIPVEDNGKIFEPFFTTRSGQGGMGLGLAISQEIIKGHGGRVDVQSGGKGQGTVFIVTLPRRTAHRSPRRPVSSLTSLSSPSRGKVL